MNRRAFFATLAAGLTAAYDPERLLWTPGKKLISIPKFSPTDAEARREFALRQLNLSAGAIAAQLEHMRPFLLEKLDRAWREWDAPQWAFYQRLLLNDSHSAESPRHHLSDVEYYTHWALKVPPGTRL